MIFFLYVLMPTIKFILISSIDNRSLDASLLIPYRAQNNCDVFMLTKQDLDEVLQHYPQIKTKILDTAEERQRMVRERAATFAKKKAEEDAAKKKAEEDAKEEQERDEVKIISSEVV